MSEQKVILLQERWTKSTARDVFSVVCAFVLIGPGLLMESAAMQWAGFLMLIVIVFSRAAGLRKKYTMTVAEARAELDRIAPAPPQVTP